MRMCGSINPSSDTVVARQNILSLFCQETQVIAETKNDVKATNDSQEMTMANSFEVQRQASN